MRIIRNHPESAQLDTLRGSEVSSSGFSFVWRGRVLAWRREVELIHEAVQLVDLVGGRRRLRVFDHVPHVDQVGLQLRQACASPPALPGDKSLRATV